MRIIVAQPSSSRLVPERDSTAPSSAPLPVGVVRWPSMRISVVVKATYRFRPGKHPLELATEHAPITQQDLVAFKPMTDVLLAGHAHAPQAKSCIQARVRLDGVDRAFSVVGAASDRLPLDDGWIRDADGATPAAPVGPCEPDRDVFGADDGAPMMRLPAPPDHEDEQDEPADDLTWEDLDDTGDLYRVGGVSLAAPEQRSTHVLSDAELLLDGLAVGGEPCETRLPGHTPVVVVETLDAWYYVTMYCDTVAIDTDASTVTLSWRGQCPHRGVAHRDIERVVVTLEDDNEEPRPLGIVYRELQRGSFAYAVEESDLDPEGDKPLPEEAAAEMLLAKYATFDLTPNPAMDLAHYTAVSVALASGQDRAEVLKRHDLDEDAWLLEEQAWTQRLTDAVGNDDELVEEHRRLARAVKQGPSRPQAGGGGGALGGDRG